MTDKCCGRGEKAGSLVCGATQTRPAGKQKDEGGRVYESLVTPPAPLGFMLGGERVPEHFLFAPYHRERTHTSRTSTGRVAEDVLSTSDLGSQRRGPRGVTGLQGDRGLWRGPRGGKDCGR